MFFYSGAKLLLSLLTAKREMINKVIAMFNFVKTARGGMKRGFPHQNGYGAEPGNCQYNNL